MQRAALCISEGERNRVASVALTQFTHNECENSDMNDSESHERGHAELCCLEEVGKIVLFVRLKTENKLPHSQRYIIPLFDRCPSEWTDD